MPKNYTLALIKSVVTTLYVSLILGFFSPLDAQQTQNVVVVSSCGSPTYRVGEVHYATMDTKGNLCGSSDVVIVDGGLVIDYSSGATATVLATTSGTVLTATITNIQHIRCWNQTGTAAVVSITDTAGVNIVPPLFSIPALGSTTFIESAVGEVWTGIKWWSGTASAILCKLKGKQ